MKNKDEEFDARKLAAAEVTSRLRAAAASPSPEPTAPRISPTCSRRWSASRRSVGKHPQGNAMAG